MTTDQPGRFQSVPLTHQETCLMFLLELFSPGLYLASRFYSPHLPDQSSILHLHPDPPCPTCSYHLRTALSTGFDPHFDPRFYYIQLKIFYYTKDLYSSKISMTRRMTEIKAQQRKCLPFGFRRKEEKYRLFLDKRCCKHYTTFLPYFRLKTPILLLLFLSSIG